MYTITYDYVICALYYNKAVKKSIGLEIRSVFAMGWVNECRLTKKRNVFGIMELFQTVTVVLVMKLYKCIIITCESVYFKRINFTTYKLCLNKPNSKKWNKSDDLK